MGRYTISLYDRDSNVREIIHIQQHTRSEFLRKAGMEIKISYVKYFMKYEEKKWKIFKKRFKKDLLSDFILFNFHYFLVQDFASV